MEDPKKFSLMEVVCGNRILDVGHPQSPFLAYGLAPHAIAWYMIGRLPADPNTQLPPYCKVTDAFFDTNPFHLLTQHIDVILFACPSAELTQDEACLRWSTEAHFLVVLTDPHQGATQGSPGFWELARKLTVEGEYEDDIFHYLLISKRPPPPGQKESLVPPHRRFPKKGEKYRLAPSYHWPNKKPGDKPPNVVVLHHWIQPKGRVEVIDTRDLLSIHLGDLGVKL